MPTILNYPQSALYINFYYGLWLPVPRKKYYHDFEVMIYIIIFSSLTAVAISNFLLFYCSGVPKNKSCQQAFNENYHLPTATTMWLADKKKETNY